MVGRYWRSRSRLADEPPKGVLHMRTLTRLALGASAISAATLLGSALPAAASSASAAHPTPGPSTRAGAIQAPKATVKPAQKAGTSARTTKTPKTATTSKTASTRKTAPANAARLGRRATVLVGHHAATTRSTRPTGTTGGRTSSNWSGYTQSSRALGRPVSAVSASWQVPGARQRVRGESEAVADWVGIGGGQSGSTSDPSLIQAGTTAVIGHSGSPSYFSWVETLPSQAVSTPVAVRSGDRMSVAIGRIAPDRWQIRMANGTTGHSWSTSVHYRSSSASADWITERPAISSTQLAPLPARRATSFRHARVNGAPVHFQPSQRITMTGGGHALATPSAPEARGDGFSVCSGTARCGATR
jgi:hypothetical protein